MDTFQAAPGSLPPGLAFPLAFLPLVFVVMLSGWASVVRGPRRTFGLVAIPLVGLLVCWALAPAIADGGNLLFVLIFVVYAAFVILYLPALLLRTVISRARQRSG